MDGFIPFTFNVPFFFLKLIEFSFSKKKIITTLMDSHAVMMHKPIYI